MLNTQNGTVAATLNADQITRMPTPTRNALNAVAFLPGVNTASSNRNSTINGLPESFLSITLDGVSNNDNFLRNTDSFFASVTPRQDAIEAVVDDAVGGGRAGRRRRRRRHDGVHDPLGRQPVQRARLRVLPEPQLQHELRLQRDQPPAEEPRQAAHVWGACRRPDRDPWPVQRSNKAFFFVHYEQIRFPNSFTRTRTVLQPPCLRRLFRYQFGSEVREVNLLQLAAANRQISTERSDS